MAISSSSNKNFDNKTPNTSRVFNICLNIFIYSICKVLLLVLIKTKKTSKKLHVFVQHSVNDDPLLLFSDFPHSLLKFPPNPQKFPSQFPSEQWLKLVHKDVDYVFSITIRGWDKDFLHYRLKLRAEAISWFANWMLKKCWGVWGGALSPHSQKWC